MDCDVFRPPRTRPILPGQAQSRLRLPRLPQESGRLRSHDGPPPSQRRGADHRAPKTPKSSSSTPAPSSIPPSRNPSTPSSKWSSTSVSTAAKPPASSSPAASSSATATRSAANIPEVDAVVGTGELEAILERRRPLRQQPVRAPPSQILPQDFHQPLDRLPHPARPRPPHQHPLVNETNGRPATPSQRHPPAAARPAELPPPSTSTPARSKPTRASNSASSPS